MSDKKADSDKKNPRISAAVIADAKEYAVHHPLNPKSEIHARVFGNGKTLSEHAGLKRIGIHHIRIAPGKESFEYHSHQFEEEFLYVLSGRAVAEIDGEEVEIGPGDFLGFAAPSVAHQIKNPFDADFVCLMGGERREVEIADFPKQRKRLIKIGGHGQVVDWDNISTLWKMEE